MQTNALSVVSLLTLAANLLEPRRAGTIAVISSVAGDRGRQSNYVYGSAKALVSEFLSGLRQRLTKVGVGVVTIKPGFVDTPMTAHLPKNPLFAKPDKVARMIVSAIARRQPVCYTPSFWWPIMTAIRWVPERLFMKLAL
jgi:short-subunit dehydrogenase